MNRVAIFRLPNSAKLLALVIAPALGMLALVGERTPLATSAPLHPLTPTGTAPLAAVTVEPLKGAPPARQQGVEAEVIALRPSGFEPREVTRPAGRVLLAVSDQSGLDGVVLRLVKVGQVVREMRLRRERRLWRNVVELTPGEYSLTEASHPEWVCRITVSP